MLAPYVDVTAVLKAWRSLQLRLRTMFGEETYRQWLDEITPAQIDGDTLVLNTPHNLTGQYLVLQKMDESIIQLLQETWPGIRRLSYTTEKPQAEEATLFSAAVSVPPAGPVALSELLAEDAPAVFDANRAMEGTTLDPRFTFDNFVVGKPNELAYAAARKVAQDEKVSFNPLFLYGGVGLGKTHLMHAIAHEIKTKTPHRTVLYLSAEKFMYRFIRALRFKDMMAFKEYFRSVDVLMIDDVQFIAGKDSTQEEFFHTFNALIDQQKQIILSADKSPTDLNGIEDRLKSRLSWGLCADIHPSTYELRLGILQAKAEKATMHVPENVVEFLAHKICSNIRELEGALNRVIAHAELIGRPITLEGTQDVLADLLRAYDRKVTIEDIQKKVCEHYAVKVADLHGARRSRNLVRPRQIAMYLCKKLTTRSLPDIGRSFGGRDHTTVLHAVRQVETLIRDDAQIAEDIDLLRRSLQFGGF
jgi:chromosomal replication initiator protein